MEDETTLAHFLADHLARHPAMQLQDVYKLLYQGVRGPEHLVLSAEAFAAALAQEYAPLQGDASLPLWEPIRPDGRLGRLHLRPFKAAGGDLEKLVHACLETARMLWGTAEELREVWAVFVQQCRQGRWERFPASAVEAFTAWLEEEGYPAAHHSEVYRAKERPAYRLVGGPRLLDVVQETASDSDWGC